MALGVEIKTFTDRDGVKHTVQGGGDVSGKADKVADAVENDIATLDREGNLLDSGTKIANLNKPQYSIDIELENGTTVGVYDSTTGEDFNTFTEAKVLANIRVFKDTSADDTPLYQGLGYVYSVITHKSGVTLTDKYVVLRGMYAHRQKTRTSTMPPVTNITDWEYINDADAALAGKMDNEYITFPLEKSQDNFIIASSTTVKNAIENFISSHTPGKLVPCQIAIATGGAPNVAAAVCHYTYVSQSDTINFYLETLSGYRLYANIQTEQGTMEPQDYPDYFDVTDTNSYFS